MCVGVCEGCGARGWGSGAADGFFESHYFHAVLLQERIRRPAAASRKATSDQSSTR